MSNNDRSIYRIGVVGSIAIILVAIMVMLGADLNYWSIQLWTMWVFILCGAAFLALWCDHKLNDPED